MTPTPTDSTDDDSTDSDSDDQELTRPFRVQVSPAAVPQQKHPVPSDPDLVFACPACDDPNIRRRMGEVERDTVDACPNCGGTKLRQRGASQDQHADVDVQGQDGRAVPGEYVCYRCMQPFDEPVTRVEATRRGNARNPEDTFRCSSCRHTFDEPIKRETKKTGPQRGDPNVDAMSPEHAAAIAARREQLTAEAINVDVFEERPEPGDGAVDLDRSRDLADGA